MSGSTDASTGTEVGATAPSECATIRELVIALSVVEDESRRIEGLDGSRGTALAAQRRLLAERERMLIEALRGHGLAFQRRLGDDAVEPGTRAEPERWTEDSTEEWTEDTNGGEVPARPAAFSPEKLDAAEQYIRHLERALVNRTMIGQAKGILMERHHLTPDAAFARLAACSQLLNRKLSDVAGDLVESGEESLPATLLDAQARGADAWPTTGPRALTSP